MQIQTDMQLQTDTQRQLNQVSLDRVQLEAHRDAGRVESAAGQFLLFGLRGALYGAEAAAVREVHWLPDLVPLAESAPDVAGVFNLRGRVVAVLDLAARLNQPRQSRRLSDCIVVLEAGDAPFAIIVHEVHRVQAIAPAQIEAPPGHNPHAAPSSLLVQSVARVHGEVVSLLSLQALSQLAQSGAGAAQNVAIAPRLAASFPALEAAADASGEVPLAQLEISTSRDETPDNLRPPQDASSQNPAALEVAQSEIARNAQTQNVLARNEAARNHEAAGVDSERAIFRERAERLMPPIATQAERGVPVALIEMGGERFGVALDSVLEFSPLRLLSPVPCCPPHIIGQMNLRGELVTLVDIGPLLHLPARASASVQLGQQQSGALRGDAAGGEQLNGGGNIVVVRHEGAALGIVIDGVRDVLHLSEAEMTTSPAIAQASGARFFSGGAFHDGQMVCILDLQKLLGEGGLVVEEAA